MKTAQFSAQIDSVSAKKDRTLSVKFGTQEMDNDSSAFLLSLMEKQIWVAVAETPVSEIDLDIPELMPEFKNDKSPSETLRARMYVYFKEKNKGVDEGFYDWYRSYLDKIGKRFLEQMPPNN